MNLHFRACVLLNWAKSDLLLGLDYKTSQYCQAWSVLSGNQAFSPYRVCVAITTLLVGTYRPPQSEFVPASAQATIKCACQNAMYIAPYSQPYIA